MHAALALARVRRRASGAVAPLLNWVEAVSDNLGHQWKRSLQLRVVVSTLTLSVIVIAILGVVLTSQITNRLLDSKVVAAREEVERARVSVEADAGGDLDGQPARLEALRQKLTTAYSDASQTAGPAGTYESVLILPGPGPQAPATAGPASQIPQRLRDYVRAGKVAYQYSTVNERDGYQGPALIIGTPASVPSLEVYLIFPLGYEQRSLAVMRGTMLAGAGVLLVLLAAIAWLVARQVVLPIRAASRIAVRFADGRLRERMAVRGEDEIARLAMSFNEMAESLAKQINTLEEFGNLQRQFTSDVSHELLTPLSTIRMATDLLHESRGELEGPLGRSVVLLKEKVDHFELLLAELLEISRHDAGMAELASEQIDVRVSVHAAAETVQHVAEKTKSKFVLDLPDEPVLADIDSRRVQRILRNLLANAFDHGEGKPVVLRLRGDENAVAITVRDQGVGLRPGEEKLVFNRFWRADESRVRTTGGTGLGLAISAEDAALHDGKLDAWGEPGAGACFRLTLPRKRGRKIVGSPLPLRPPSRRAAARAAEIDRDTEPSLPMLDPDDAPEPSGSARAAAQPALADAPAGEQKL